MITLLEDVSWTNYAIAGGFALVLIFGILALTKRSTAYLLIGISGWGIMFLGNYYQATALGNEREFACNTLRQMPNCVEDSDGTMNCNPGSVWVYACHGIPK